MPSVWIGVTPTATSRTIPTAKQAIRQRGAGNLRTPTAYAATRSGTTRSASGFHVHAYGSTALR